MRSSPPSPAPNVIRIDRDTTDAARGIFILLVILHHSASGLFLNPLERSLISTVVSFHVPCFFMLTYVLRSKFNFKELLPRLLIPYFIFLVFYWIVFTSWKSGLSPESVRALAAAALWPTNDALEAAAGMSAMWFLPTFALFLVMTAAVKALPPGPLGRPLATGAAFALGSALLSLNADLPYHVDVALFCTGLGGLAAALLRRLWPAVSGDRARLWGVAAGALAVVLLVRFGSGTVGNFAGHNVRSFAGPWGYPLVAALILAAFVGILALCELGLKRLPWLVFCGRLSLELYLIHLFFMAATRVAVTKAGVADLSFVLVGRFLLIVGVTVALLRVIPTPWRRLVFVR